MQEAVDYDTLTAISTSLAAEAKSLERRARDIKRQSAILRDSLTTLQAKEATSDDSANHDQ
jgi:hypothetical protein